LDRVYSFQIPANDVERAKKFYGQVFGWQLTPTGAQYDYTIARTTDSDDKGQPKNPGSINGAIYDRAGGNDGIRISINVKYMDEVLNNVKTLGGTVVHEKSKIEGYGYFAEIVDPEGNNVNLFQDS
jgi:predicted enzyme related to lactoylglutathione lyase